MLFCRNRAIADYLRSNGYEEAYSVFKKEAELDVVSSNKILHLHFNLEVCQFYGICICSEPVCVAYLLAQTVSELEVMNSYSLLACHNREK